MGSNPVRLPQLLKLLESLISRLRLRVLPPGLNLGGPAKADPSGRAPAAAQELLMDLIKEVGDLRSQRGFEWKDEVDGVVGVAIEVVGVQGVLEVLPLNIEPDA